MIIDGDSGSDGEPSALGNVAGAAYRESIASVDGFSRGPNGRIKFNKDTKKRRRGCLTEECDAVPCFPDVAFEYSHGAMALKFRPS